MLEMNSGLKRYALLMKSALNGLGLENLPVLDALKDLAVTLSKKELLKQVEAIYDQDLDLIDED
eukprot:CAMPEP_0202965090 /NCGR_PEP_ID=MMETSP1396-20130829/9189_1 /ASSEMBLY_ACC=CAM_ASM_000872 /TAXON_ID= /ORGANISM="Pseudokeronopsis sp., Strain Brazil" /LENGTH=63 /DNA_ID=CAMNT_0049687705 /DNA_START=291 /DNA_END=482 /DNA_ORIENTATION=+